MYSTVPWADIIHLNILLVFYLLEYLSPSTATWVDGVLRLVGLAGCRPRLLCDWLEDSPDHH